MKKNLLFTFLTGFILFVYGQHNLIWHFGNGAKLDFNTIPPTPLNTSKVLTSEGSSSISDQNGNELFYTNGNSVYDRNGNKMPNGSRLKGNFSATTSSVIVPQPNNKSIYFIFTSDNSREKTTSSNGFYYYQVDMNLNGGFGDIIDHKGKLLYNNNTINYPTEKMTVAKHANGIDYWIIIAPQQFRNTIYAYHLSAEGLNNIPVISHVGSSQSVSGYLKANLEGNRLASTVSSGIEIYNFNKKSGIVSNPQKISSLSNAYGIEFSPNGQVLYATKEFSPGSLYKFDLTSGKIDTTQTTIVSNTRTQGALCLGPDEKIYVAYTNEAWNQYLGVINNPNDFRNPEYNPKQILFDKKVVFKGLPTFAPTHKSSCIPQNLAITVLHRSPTCEINNQLTASWTQETDHSYKVKWYKKNQKNNILSNQNTLTITEGGIYTVEISDKKNPSCKSILTSEEIIFLPKDKCKIIQKNQSINDKVQITPNPFQNNTSILIDIPSSIEIHDINGNMIQTFNNTSEVTIGDHLSSGVYFVFIQNDHGIFHQKVVKE